MFSSKNATTSVLKQTRALSKKAGSNASRKNAAAFSSPLDDIHNAQTRRNLSKSTVRSASEV